MVRNTRSAEVTVLWMHGSLPLALTLLIAAVGAAIPGRVGVLPRVDAPGITPPAQAPRAAARQSGDSGCPNSR